jgi:hypothetical protein
LNSSSVASSRRRDARALRSTSANRGPGFHPLHFAFFSLQY